MYIESHGTKYLLFHHAAERFKERYNLLYSGTLKNPIATLQTLLDKSSTDLEMHSNYKRLARHGGDTTYLVSGGWRFVVAGKNRIVTIERVRKHENKF